MQEDLRARLSSLPPRGKVRLMAGCDAIPSADGRRIFAAAIVYRLPGLTEEDRACAELPLRFPYVPGLLSFREGPALLAAFQRLQTRPDAVLFDGQGRAHPKRMGLASHMGLWLGLPTVGCAKSCLTGRYRTPAERAGASTPLIDGAERIGAALRTRTGIKPVFVSAGHMMDLRTAVSLTLRCCDGLRLPKPTREADRWTREWKRGRGQGAADSSDPRS